MLPNSVYRVALVLLTLAALAGGVFFVVRATSSGPALEILLPTPTSTPELRVYVSGEVHNPGVYTLASGDRIVDALEAAGGATQNADLSRVNLAQRVRDQDDFLIPSLGLEASGDTADAVAKINLNSASLEKLISLPGIGPVRAQAIVAYREANGPFVRVDQIMAVEGIGPATYEAVRDLVTVE